MGQMSQCTVEVDFVDLSSATITKIAASNVPMDDCDKALLSDILMDLGPVGKEESYLNRLDTEDSSPLVYLSVLLATRSSFSTAGNICVALSESKDGTLFIATNADVANSTGSVLRTLSDKQNQFLDLFNSDLESRRRSLRSEAVGRQVRHFANIYKKPTIISKVKADNTAIQFCNKLATKCTPRVRGPDETDDILSGLCDLLYQWQRISAKESALHLDVFCIEIITLYLTYSADEELLNLLVDTMTMPIANYLAVNVLDMICHVGTVQDMADAERAISNAFKGIANKYKVVQKMRTGLMSFHKYTKIVQVHSTGEITSRSGVVHCEVKLYLYMLQNGFDTVVPFHISKQLCMDCAMFFYSNVKGETRPVFQAAYRDHFKGVACRTACSAVDAAFGTIRHCCGVKKKKK